MKIATWNIERLKHKSKHSEMLAMINEIDADILVLTETDSRLQPSVFKSRIDTPKLPETEPINYKDTENRVSIFTKYFIVNQFETFDKYTSVCLELKTEFGNLRVYGTIIGIYGNRNKNFKIDLKKQIEDIDKLASGHNFCLIGDYNISFSDNYYYTTWGKEELNLSFDKNGLELVSRERKNCIDHIALSKTFIGDKEIEVSEWNEDKKLSDHKGILINIKT